MTLDVNDPARDILLPEDEAPNRRKPPVGSPWGVATFRAAPEVDLTACFNALRQAGVTIAGTAASDPFSASLVFIVEGGGVPCQPLRPDGSPEEATPLFRLEQQYGGRARHVLSGWRIKGYVDVPVRGAP